MTRRAPAYRLLSRLGTRDLAILDTLQEFRLASGSQLRRLHFAGGQPATQARKSRAVLQRLTQLNLLTRLERRVGGIRSGSEGYVYGLSGLGHAVLDLGEPEPRRHRGVPDTKPAFEAHVLAVSELAVCLTERERTGAFTVEELRAEPGCWRWFAGIGGDRRTLKPDAFVRLGVGDYELAWFVEMDMASESLPTIQRKCSVYVDYWRSGVEQRASGLFPRVWWLVPHARRLQTIGQVIRRLPEEARELFAVALHDRAPELLAQLPNTEGGAL